MVATGSAELDVKESVLEEREALKDEEVVREVLVSSSDDEGIVRELLGSTRADERVLLESIPANDETDWFLSCADEEGAARKLLDSSDADDAATE